MHMRPHTIVMSYRLARSLLDDLRNKHANLRDSYANLRSTPANLRDSHSNLRSARANLRTGVLKNVGSRRLCRKAEHWNIKETAMPIWHTVARAT